MFWRVKVCAHASVTRQIFAPKGRTALATGGASPRAQPVVAVRLLPCVSLFASRRAARNADEQECRTSVLPRGPSGRETREPFPRVPLASKPASSTRGQDRAPFQGGVQPPHPGKRRPRGSRSSPQEHDLLDPLDPLARSLPIFTDQDCKTARLHACSLAFLKP